MSKKEKILDIARTIDHTLLKPEATLEQIDTLCSEALDFQFAAVCVNPCWVAHCRSVLNGSKVHVCTVVGFPLGANDSIIKANEAEVALKAGATEIDMVINIGFLKSGKFAEVAQDIKAVRNSVVAPNLLKVIIEATTLSPDEIRRVSTICVEEGADFVKTSTGMHPSGGARLDDVKLIREVVGSGARIKAAGGIRDRAGALSFLNAGADRIGCSASVKIVTEA